MNTLIQIRKTIIESHDNQTEVTLIMKDGTEVTGVVEGIDIIFRGFMISGRFYDPNEVEVAEIKNNV